MRRAVDEIFTHRLFILRMPVYKNSLIVHTHTHVETYIHLYKHIESRTAISFIRMNELRETPLATPLFVSKHSHL